ncbi:MAG: hypothetical protein R3Y39_06125 [Rikenellaceae bacterium]
MKEIFLSLALFCASFMVSCGGNAEVDKINQLVVEATEQTKAATSSQEVAKIAAELQAEMDKITAEAGDKLTFGKSVDEALAKYQEAAAAKLAEFGIELE